MDTKKLAASLRELKREKTDPFFDLGERPTVFEQDGRICVSAEDGGCWADYYMEFGLHKNSDTPGVDPKLCEWANKHGCYWEWINPGAIVLSH